MEAISDYMAANPAAATLLTIFVVFMILYFILKKFIKLAIVVIFILLLVGGITLFKDPATMPDKIKSSIDTLKAGKEQIGDKFKNFWADSKELAGKAKKVPGDINQMLDTAKKDAGK
jgi:hypothetical protein